MEEVSSGANSPERRGIWLAVCSLCEDALAVIERNPVLRLASVVGAMLGFVVLMATAYQITLDLGDRREEREVRRQEAIARAWDRLLLRASGNVGKGDAMSLLIAEGSTLHAVDLSCEAIGSYDTERGCLARPVFSGVQAGGHGARATISDVNLREAEIHGMQLQAVEFKASLEHARIEESRFVDTSFWMKSDGLRFLNTDILDSVFQLELVLGNEGYQYPMFQGVNISGSDLPMLPTYIEDDWNSFYFWADRPPYRDLRVPDQSRQRHDPQVLGRATICLPPVDGRGNERPLAERPVMSRGLADKTSMHFCEEMTLEEAARRYPEMYLTAE